MITERLNKIKKRCEELLEIAAKRKPGRWEVEYKRHDTGSYSVSTTYCPFLKAGKEIIAEGWESDEKEALDFEYAASCTGPAEAGWRATISVIDAYEMILHLQRDSDSMTEVLEHVEYSVDQILAAWSEELL